MAFVDLPFLVSLPFFSILDSLSFRLEARPQYQKSPIPCLAHTKTKFAHAYEYALLFKAMDIASEQ